jgi:hypothetical protein
MWASPPESLVPKPISPKSSPHDPIRARIDSRRLAVIATDSLLEDLLGARPVSRRRAERGYTPAERWVIELDDGRSVFVKAATNELTAGWLRNEYRLYQALRALFMPRLHTWRDSELPILVLEDLSAATWPRQWSDEQVSSVLETLRAVAATPPPDWLPSASSSGFLERGWHDVGADPGPLLSTGVVSRTWLDEALPRLLEEADACHLDGTNLLHLDVRSDNICFRADGSAVLVDWNLAVVGNPRLDIAFWLPALASEGGPTPEAILSQAGREAAFVSGFFAARAGQPPIPGAPAIRPLQFVQLQQALPWACRELGLPLP